MLLFVAEVLSEEPILKWYKDAHVAKGKSVFLEQMKKFVEWLKNAEEGKSSSVDWLERLVCVVFLDKTSWCSPEWL